jgi:hypothetical protein
MWDFGTWREQWYALPMLLTGLCLCSSRSQSAWRSFTRTKLVRPPPPSGSLSRDCRDPSHPRDRHLRVRVLLDGPDSGLVVAKGWLVSPNQPDYDHFLHIARNMKRYNDEIVAAIQQVQEAQHGVVGLFFTNAGRDMEIRILDEPFDDNVRVYAGE